MKGTKNNKEEERKNILWLTIADKPASSRSDLAKYVKRIPIFKLKALDQKITNLLTQLKNEGKIVNVGTGRKGARYSTSMAPVLSVQSQYEPKSKWQKPATPVNTKGRLSGLSKESVRMIMVQTEIEDKVLSQLNNPDELIYLAMTKK